MPISAASQSHEGIEEMAAMTAPAPRSTALPRLNADTLMIMMLAGAFATVAFDLFGQAISPALGFGTLAPVPLARGTLNLVLGAGAGSAAAGHFMHLALVGLIAYPLGWLALARPVLARLGLGWAAGSALYGAALWAVAIGGIASMVTGNLFLGFSTITWVALVGHVLYGLALGAGVAWLEGRRA